MDQTGQPALAEVMNRLWEQFLPHLEERVVALEAAAEALAGGTLALAEREQASSAAHKLAGVLGTFGLPEGTILAREAEVFYSAEPQADPATAVRLGEIAAELRALLASRE
jgi:HPt (histidine-containing phosphotransfer) domain-containing protein